MLQLQGIVALVFLLHCVVVPARTLQQNTTEQRVPFCSGRSTMVSLVPSSALVLDGSNSVIAPYSIVSPFPQPGAMCTCTLSPTNSIGNIGIALTSNIDPPSVYKCTKNLRITVTPDYDYSKPCDAGDQSHMIDTVGNRSIAVTLYILNGDIDDKYHVMIRSSMEEEINFRVTCFPSSKVPSSSTSLSPSTTPYSSTAGLSTTNGSSNENTATGLSTDQSNTVLVVCVIIGVGLLMMVLVICLLCCIARRLGHWKTKKDIPRTPQRIYRRIRHTIRQLPQTLNLRRPLPSPPENPIHEKLKNRSPVFVTDSGPYDSIKASIRPNRMLPPKLDGDTLFSSDKSDYEYLYPVNKTDSKQKCVTSSDDPYITPIRESRHHHDLPKHETNKEQDNLYINILKKSTGTDKATENVDMTDNAGIHSSDYMTMDFKTKEDRDCHVNCQHTEQNDVEISIINDQVLSSTNTTINKSTPTPVQHSDHDVYINMTSVTDMASRGDGKAIAGDAKETRKPRDSGYVSMGEMEVNKVSRPSWKDRTFPNLLQFHKASIKPKFHFSKKRKPEVMPKPKRYVRNMAGDIEK